MSHEQLLLSLSHETLLLSMSHEALLLITRASLHRHTKLFLVEFRKIGVLEKKALLRGFRSCILFSIRPVGRFAAVAVAFMCFVLSHFVNSFAALAFIGSVSIRSTDRFFVVAPMCFVSSRFADRFLVVAFICSVLSRFVDGFVAIAFVCFVSSRFVDRFLVVAFIGSVSIRSVDGFVAIAVAFMWYVSSGSVDRFAAVAFTCSVSIRSVDGFAAVAAPIRARHSHQDLEGRRCEAGGVNRRRLPRSAHSRRGETIK